MKKIEFQKRSLSWTNQANGSTHKEVGILSYFDYNGSDLSLLLLEYKNDSFDG